MSADVRKIPNVFVSYSWHNKSLGRRMARRLAHLGVNVTFDETEFESGQALTAKIQQELRSSTHMVVIWTAEAAASTWVQREIQYAAGLGADGPVVIPLLVVPPGADSLVADRVGVQYFTPYRFERAFKQLAEAITCRAPIRGTPAQLIENLAAVFSEAPRLARLLKNPVEEQHARLTRERGLAAFDLDMEFRQESLKTLTETFEAWQNLNMSLLGLPNASDPDYHALDFALWCSVYAVLDKRGELSLSGLLPIELGPYPAIFARVFGATQAGYDALVVLLGEYPNLGLDVMNELTAANRVADESLAGVIDLFEIALKFVNDTSGRDQYAPHAPAASFFRRNRRRLSMAQKESLVGLIETYGNGPYPGAPLDLLQEMFIDPDLTKMVVERVTGWIDGGLFDGPDSVRRATSPLLFYGFVKALLQQNVRSEVANFLKHAHGRIRKLFRSAKPALLVSALNWIADAEVLPLPERGFVREAYLAGVVSSEFEQAEHSALIRSLAERLVRSVTSEEEVDIQLRHEVRRQLLKHDLPDTFRA